MNCHESNICKQVLSKEPQTDGIALNEELESWKEWERWTGTSDCNYGSQSPIGVTPSGSQPPDAPTGGDDDAVQF